MSFALQVPVFPRSLEAMKGYLTRAIPEVKSSHRCEALARALGFRTYASLLCASRSAGGCSAIINFVPFQGYLNDHGFNIGAEHVFLAGAMAALTGLYEREPLLTAWGIGAGERQLKSDGKWETHREREARFLRERQELLFDGNTESFLLSLALLRRIPSTKTVRSGTGSYRLKHIAENYAASYPSGNALGPFYVSNGVLIAAAIHAGYHYKTHINDSGYENVNVLFNMSKRAIDDLDCEIRPNGATAQDRQRRREMRPLFRHLRIAGFDVG